MHRSIPIAAACCAIAAVAIIPAPASAVPIHVHKVKVVGDQPWHFESVTIVKDVAPSDRDDDGFADQKDDCPKVAGPNGGCPPPKPPPAPESTAPVSYSAPAPVTSSGGCPSYMSGEASSPTDVNPASGASGCYQVLPSTAAAMNAIHPGSCVDVNASSCVAAICEEQGNGAWASSGATPC